MAASALARPARQFEETKTGEEGKHAAKFNSQELDKETGYYFMNARHYDPEVGRFVTADSVVDGEGSTQGWNRYMYVKGNPVRYSDPTGHNRKENIVLTGHKIAVTENKNGSLTANSNSGYNKKRNTRNLYTIFQATDNAYCVYRNY